jgi:hypothetical protein
VTVQRRGTVDGKVKIDDPHVKITNKENPPKERLSDGALHAQLKSPIKHTSTRRCPVLAIEADLRSKTFHIT